MTVAMSANRSVRTFAMVAPSDVWGAMGRQSCHEFRHRATARQVDEESPQSHEGCEGEGHGAISSATLLRVLRGFVVNLKVAARPRGKRARCAGRGGPQGKRHTQDRKSVV